ncbi:MAG: DNA repair protein RecN [Haemophilus parainfluenzae]|jgi:DNA repair protein RecN|uniref:DNA repair protein RecN n=1 Tax=Haemophilus parainfluenzae TaxID=729 RepID=A0AAQ0H0D6_HAEPA|nr:DNA repair protein RecN [Haemophilus parainfluenzae]MDU4564992.1 DNA repair protein RecN [Haemophilus parainfluenzae]MDU4636976.1 DNA repair protein RecN [Haemophilus parainfluenzae]MDU5008624.1 DNA repair protein RecN [Haemophilus parainfluenzae]MDU5989675.1 DNA repair protein RecN [Haemophilus parainfluenzae]RDE84990.1 DNA repair protein RecN [Haemophilus parainfluenzae]
MLTQLTINNFAIVRQLEIELAKGMSVITGETGAGKSIAIDALGLCLGQRIETSMVREGQERAEICATFFIEPTNPAYQWLQEQELQDPDNPSDCILRRVINADGRSKAFINSTPVSASQLKEIGQYLIHINGQHASQLLLKNDYQLQLVDTFAHHNDLLAQMREDYRAWKNLQTEVKNFQQKVAENEAKKQLLQYQVEELDEFALRPNEYLELEEDQRRLSNSEQLTQLSQSALQLLSENETVSIDSMLYRATQYIDELSELDPRYVSVQTMLNDALIQVQEATSEVQHLASHIEQDPMLLQEIEQRLGQALQLARKHNVKPEELVEWHQKLKAELTTLLDFSESEERLILEEKSAFEKMQNTAKQLHESRSQAAEKLAQQVTDSIKGLAMENAEFFIEVNSDLAKVAANGADNIVFTLRSNLGQQAQPLAKVASGGELSRISLAIQVLTSDQSAIPTLIFDEVDVGISGKTASVVGKLLRQLGDKCQVLCVTHLPQVACHGHHQFNVEKFTVDDKTETKMTALSQEERVPALARLLGGSEITDLALANAQEMLDLVK